MSSFFIGHQENQLNDSISKGRLIRFLVVDIMGLYQDNQFSVCLNMPKMTIIATYSCLHLMCMPTRSRFAPIRVQEAECIYRKSISQVRSLSASFILRAEVSVIELADHWLCPRSHISSRSRVLTCRNCSLSKAPIIKGNKYYVFQNPKTDIEKGSMTNIPYASDVDVMCKFMLILILSLL